MVLAMTLASVPVPSTSTFSPGIRVVTACSLLRSLNRPFGISTLVVSVNVTTTLAPPLRFFTVRVSPVRVVIRPLNLIFFDPPYANPAHRVHTNAVHAKTLFQLLFMRLSFRLLSSLNLHEPIALER